MPKAEPRPPEIDAIMPGEAERAALRATLAAAGRDPWLASLVMRRLGAMRERLGALRARIAELPRHARRQLLRRWALAAPLASLLFALGGGTGQAATITVDIGAACTLSAAIINANNDDQSGSIACTQGSGADTIVLAGGTYLLNTAYAGALPDIESEITIQGNGATLDAQDAFRVLRVRSTGDLTLEETTLAGGSNNLIGGGGLFNEGSASLTSCAVTSNSGYNGGGINNRGSLRIEASSISGNSAASQGGGIYAEGDVTILHSTISDNTANVGGGILNIAQAQGGGLRISGSTISGNTGYDAGGGIANGNDIDYVLVGGVAEIVNTTISGNEAGLGGGIYNYYGSVSLIHTTITRNFALFGGSGIYSSDSASTMVSGSIVAEQQLGSDDCAAGAPTSIISNGFNLESGSSCDFTATGDIQNGDPDLGPLALNAPGTTATHAIGLSSDALHAANNAVCAASPVDGVDQRGVTRPQPPGGVCDIGAFELELVATPTPPPTAAQVLGFAAAPDPTGRVRITWQTESEVGVAGFRVQRAEAPPGQAAGAWTVVSGLIPARGGAGGATRYAADDAPGVGHFLYRLEVVNTDGAPEVHGPAATVVRAIRAFLPWAGRR